MHGKEQCRDGVVNTMDNNNHEKARSEKVAVGSKKILAVGESQFISIIPG